jgi:hypothetical protein
MFNVGDYIDYCFYKGITVVDKDDIHYTVEDKYGNICRLYINLVNKYGKINNKGKKNGTTIDKTKIKIDA